MIVRTGLVLLSFSAFATTAFAQGDRAGTWEAGFSISDFSSESVQGSSGSGLDVESEVGYGFALNYNVTDRLAVGGDLIFSSPDYQAVRVVDGSLIADTVDAEMDIATLQFKGTFYFTEGALAPYAEIGAGWSKVDSNLVEESSTSCWWDPWWGYVCADYYETYSDTRTSLGYGLGLRWELSDAFVARASYSVLEIDGEYTGDTSVDALRVDFQWRF